jgi:glucuronate isomerase
VSDALQQRLFDALESLVLIDPHTHINPHAPASKTLADIMGYHYYTELAHSAGLAKSMIEEPGLDPKTKVGRLVEFLPHLDNTIQVSWLVEMCREFFGFDRDRITQDNWEKLYDTAAKKMAEPDWEQQCLKQSKLEAVFLTNDFDDPLTGFDTKKYIPCLRTDDLVFKLDQPKVRERLAKATGIEVGDAKSIRAAIRKLFEHFTAKGARACAISLPPWFEPIDVSENSEDLEYHLKVALGDKKVRRELVEEMGEESLGEFVELSQVEYVSSFVFWTLASAARSSNSPST